MSYDTEKAKARAKQIDAEGRRRFDAINADATLTLAGKAPKFAEADAPPAVGVREGGAAVRSATQGQPRGYPCVVPVVG